MSENQRRATNGTSGAGGKDERGASSPRRGRLFFITDVFPFPGGEVFVTPELPYLAARFETVHILPLNAGTTLRQVLPENCILHTHPELATSLREAGEESTSPSMFIRHAAELASEARFIRLSRWRLYAALKALRKADRVEELLADLIEREGLRDCQFYSFWLNPVVHLPLLRLKQRGLITGEIFSRTHRYDLYWEASELNYLPFFRFMATRLNRIFVASEHARSYLAAHLGLPPAVIPLARLGVPGVEGRTRPSEDGVLRIVSVSNLRPVKRIHRIAEALRAFRCPVEWIHVGDGIERERIESIIRELPRTIHATIRGWLEPEVIAEHYRTQPVDLFLNVSDSEGVPVSVMEALRFGIPVAATAVCGTPEILGQDSGYLLPADFRPADLRHLIEGHAALPPARIAAMREAAFRQWDSLCRADRNYPGFVEQLLPREA